MRLINTETGYFEEFVDSTTAPHYAILSHTWDGQEQSYQDVMKIQQRFRELQSSYSEKEPHTLSHATLSIHQAVEEMGSLPGPSIPEDTEPLSGVAPIHPSPTHPSIWDSDSGLSRKIREACRAAREDGYRYIWVDSSCIDKTSSSELSEAINSMFNWYRDAQICYAFLSDVPSDEDVRAESPYVSWYQRDRMPKMTPRKFRASRWFERSWTLQELIAPPVVVFLSKDWKGLGTKHSLAELIEEITRIDRDVLTHKKSVADESVAERMRWAATRRATRVEDEAYSLLGIFGITMTTVYGEGENAFQRLQEEILQRIPDRSLFGWHSKDHPLTPIHISHWETNPYSTLDHVTTMSPFAKSPRLFTNNGGKINTLSEQHFKSPQLPVEEYSYSLTPHGIRARIRLIPMKYLAPNLQLKRPGKHTRFGEPFPDSIESWYLMFIGTQQHTLDRGQTTTYLLGKLCCVIAVNSSIQLLKVPRNLSEISLIWTDLELDTQSLLEKPIDVDVYLPRPTPSVGERKPAGDKPSRSQSTTVSFSPWASGAVPPGYSISEVRWHCSNQDRRLWPHDPSSLSLLLSNTDSSVMLNIQYRHMPYITDQVPLLGGPTMGTDFKAFLEARVWIVSPNSTLDEGAPYASAIWSADEKSLTLPIQYIPVPVRQSGESTWIILQLWLGISKYGHYHAHVEVATYTVNPTDAYKGSTRCLDRSFDDAAPLHVPEPHPDFKFTMLGATKRALEAQGYSMHLEASDGNSSNSHSSHSYSLMISDSIDPTFTISIQYFHNRCTRPGKNLPQFIFVARVTLESTPDQGSEKYQDGPYVLNWADNCEWSWDNARSPIYLSTPCGDVLRLKLTLDRAWVSEYYLVVDLARRGDSNSQTGVSGHHPKELQFRLVDPHDHINLTLPTHIRRALQTHGYEAHFEGEDNVYHLTLSNANHTINIEYFHHLSTGPGGQRGLTFQACVTTSVLQSSQDAAAQNECRIVNWGAWRWETHFENGEVDEEGGWRWNLHNKDVKLTLPDGIELTLRLSLYLVWLSEYCITVEVNLPADDEEYTTDSASDSGAGSAHRSSSEASTSWMQRWSSILEDPEAWTSRGESPTLEALENAPSAAPARPTVGLEAIADSPAAASIMLPTMQSERHGPPLRSPFPVPLKKSLTL